ncbi:hypothetical protein [Glycomyces sp. NPDC021274]|uniref:hypothetical protein n=1 Tax=Glycomyces sp. NPDC021274 TaxID=3155120 RepID=UPI0033F45C57
METVHNYQVSQQACGREGCDTVPPRGEEFCSVLHRRQHELVNGYEPHPETFPQDTCALEGCGKPSRRMSRYCSSDHNAATANRGGEL